MLLSLIAKKTYNHQINMPNNNDNIFNFQTYDKKINHNHYELQITIIQTNP